MRKPCKIFFLLLLLIFGVRSVWAQEDAVFLFDGREAFGLIVEEVPFSHIRIQTTNFQIRTYAFEDITDVFRPKAIKGYWDVVYLKNGGVIRGFIVEYEWGKFLKIEDERGNDFAWRMDDIRKINKEPTPNDATFRRSAEGERTSRRELREANHQGIQYGSTIVFLEVGGQVASPELSAVYPGALINILVAYRLDNRFSLGVGLGADILYNVNDSRNTGRYAFGDMRIYFPQKKNMPAPYLSLASGYDWFRSGIMFNPGVGMRVNLWRNQTVNLNLGLKMHYESQDTRNTPGLLGVTELVQFKVVID